jgi:hydroxyacyl-ACP dehydratase HTD2-like protein with hotdog domain
MPAPPGFMGVPRTMPGEPEPGPPIRGLHPDLTRSLNGGTEYAYRSPVMAGDELVATTAIVEIKERTGSVGPMLLITRETTFRRDGEVVAVLRATAINY